MHNIPNNSAGGVENGIVGSSCLALPLAFMCGCQKRGGEEEDMSGRGGIG